MRTSIVTTNYNTDKYLEKTVKGVFDQKGDFGIRLYEKGLYNVYTPYAELIHYESVSRFEDKGLERDEVNALKLRKKWGKYIYDLGGRDPFYNINLSYGHEDFRVGLK